VTLPLALSLACLPPLHTQILRAQQAVCGAEAGAGAGAGGAAICGSQPAVRITLDDGWTGTTVGTADPPSPSPTASPGPPAAGDTIHPVHTTHSNASATNSSGSGGRGRGRGAAIVIKSYESMRANVTMMYALSNPYLAPYLIPI